MRCLFWICLNVSHDNLPIQKVGEAFVVFCRGNQRRELHTTTHVVNTSEIQQQRARQKDIVYINCTRYAILNFHISRGFYYRMTWTFTMTDFRNLVPWLLVFTGMRPAIHLVVRWLFPLMRSCPSNWFGGPKRCQKMRPERRAEGCDKKWLKLVEWWPCKGWFLKGMWYSSHSPLREGCLTSLFRWF